MKSLTVRLPRRRWIVAFPLLVVLASSMFVSASASGAAKAPFVLGIVIGKSSFMAPYDNPVQNGAQIAIDQINKSGGLLGHQIEVLVDDNQSSASLATTEADQVIAQGAQALIDSSALTIGGPSGRVAGQHDIPNFGVAGQEAFGVTGVGPYTYNIANVNVLNGAASAQFAYKKGFRHAWVLDDTSFSFNAVECNAFITRFKQLAGPSAIVGQDTFENADPSEATQANAIKSASPTPDVIEMCSSPPGAATALRDIRAAGLKTAIIGSEAMDGNYWIKTVPTLSNFYYPAYASIWGDDPNPAVNTFFKEYAARYGPTTTSTAIYGYCIIEALQKAVDDANSITGPAIQAALNKFKNVPLLCGSTTFTAAAHWSPGRSPAMIKVTNGKFSFDTLEKVTDVPPEQL